MNNQILYNEGTIHLISKYHNGIEIFHDRIDKEKDKFLEERVP